MAITPADIEQQTFSPSKHGYDTEEVDAFLEQIAVEIDAMLQKIADLKGRLNSTESQLSAAQAQVASLQDASAAAPAPAPAPAVTAPAEPVSSSLAASERQISQVLIVAQQTPELQPSIFELLKRDYDAIILETFGIGGIPDTLHDAIFGWVDSGRTLVVTTQVPEEGLDLGVYEVGRAYADNPGVLKGDDMSTEALVAKTMWVLGQTRDPKSVRELFYREINHDRTPR